MSRLAVLLLVGAGLLVAPTPASVAAGCAATPTVDVGTATVPLGGALHLTGTGWCHPDGGGSRIGVKIDEGAISHLDTSVHANKTIWAIVEAAADGSFAADVVLPDGTTATSDPALGTGPHTLRLLSGSLRAGDTVRTLQSSIFDVVGDGATGAPPWAHTTLTAAGATAWVERTVAAGDGRTIRLRGTGWTGGSGASTVAVKLGSSPDGGQYRRSGAGVVTHPSASGDDTIWALIAPGGGAHPNVRTMGTDGSFEVSLDLPDGLVAGQYLTVSLASGRFAAGDTQRSVTSDALVVGGVAWTGDDGGSDVTCVPTSASPTVRLGSTSASFGGTLRITGTGWCNPAGGGSRIGVKIDEGAISHLDAIVHTNKTIWAIVEARDSDGTFTADLRLPDGTAATSTPALRRGAHTLRLLSGSLAAGDTIRTLQSEAFVVGAYRPNGTPDPLRRSALQAGTRHGLTARLAGRRLHVTVPGTAAGDWVFLSAYAADGSPRYPWSVRWFRVRDGGRLQARATDAALTGRMSLTAQAGGLDTFGQLLGWAPVRFPAAQSAEPDPASPTAEPDPEESEDPADPVDPADPSPTATPSVAPTLTPPFSAVPTVVAPGVPAAPATSYVALGVLPAGGASAELGGTVLTLRLPVAAPGDVVAVTVYGVTASSAGLATLADDASLVVDLAAVAPGAYRVAGQAADGTLLGWADVTVPEPADGTDGTDDAGAAVTTTPVSAVTAEPAPWFGPSDAWLLVVGLAGFVGVAAGTGAGRPRRRSA